jgi:hypothetical protein
MYTVVMYSDVHYSDVQRCTHALAHPVSSSPSYVLRRAYSAGLDDNSSSASHHECLESVQRQVADHVTLHTMARLEPVCGQGSGRLKYHIMTFFYGTHH